MAKFISREKLSKKARKELDNQKRAVWAFSPTTRKVESKKLYNRKKSTHAWKWTIPNKTDSAKKHLQL